MTEAEALTALIAEARKREAYFLARAGLTPNGKTVACDAELDRARNARRAIAFGGAAVRVERLLSVLNR